MILILCSARDTSALAMRASLAAASAAPVDAVTTMELVTAPRLAQALGAEGCRNALTLRRLGPIDPRLLRGVLNRIDTLPEAHLMAMEASERHYVLQELQAVLASWLRALPCPVVNRPTAASLAGPTYHEAVWRHMAATAGLPVSERPLDPDQPDSASAAPTVSTVVFRGRCYGTVPPPPFGTAILALAARSGADLLEVFLHAESDRGLVFSAATPFVALERGGSPLVRDLAATFGAAPGAPA